MLYLPCHHVSDPIEVSGLLALYGYICGVKDLLLRLLAHAKMVVWGFYLCNRFSTSLLKH